MVSQPGQGPIANPTMWQTLHNKHVSMMSSTSIASTRCDNIKDPTAQNALLSEWFWIFLSNFHALLLE